MQKHPFPARGGCCISSAAPIAADAVTLTKELRKCVCAPGVCRSFSCYVQLRNSERGGLLASQAVYDRS